MCNVILFCPFLQNRRPSVYLPTREYPSEQSKYTKLAVLRFNTVGEMYYTLLIQYILFK